MSPTDSHLTSQRYLDGVREFYNTRAVALNRTSRDYRSLLAHYYNLLIPPTASVLEIGCGTGELLLQLRAGRKVGIDLSSKQISVARERLPGCEFHVQAGEYLQLEEQFDYIILSDTLNTVADVQQLLERLHTVSHEGTRLIINFHSSLWRPIFGLAKMMGLKPAEPPSSWLSSTDVRNLLTLSDWMEVTNQGRILLPVKVFGLEKVLNRWFAPCLSFFCLTRFSISRPVRTRKLAPLSVSVVIPARNEAGNIKEAIMRVPQMGTGTELIFVEGHSRDTTWEAIQQVARDYPHLKIKIMQQTGKGKGDAVRMGFAAASGEVLMILDADLTMPPEELPKFYAIIASGRAEFANGCRLVYPMDENAMPFLNLCANKIWGAMFSWMMGQPVKDTLCGTKVLHRKNYDAIAANRSYFGDFDPFGDFDLLFGAAKLNLKIADVPIRYAERTYGSTNIQRWRHGWLLMRMVLFASRKLKFI